MTFSGRLSNLHTGKDKRLSTFAQQAGEGESLDPLLLGNRLVSLDFEVIRKAFVTTSA